MLSVANKLIMLSVVMLKCPGAKTGDYPLPSGRLSPYLHMFDGGTSEHRTFCSNIIANNNICVLFSIMTLDIKGL
jgi:hypothetical protein